MFNSIIYYTFILTHQQPYLQDQTLVTIGLWNWARPVVGSDIRIHGKKYRVAKCVPSNNPDNISVTYYIEDFNPNWPYAPHAQKMRLKYNSTNEADNLLQSGI